MSIHSLFNYTISPSAPGGLRPAAGGPSGSTASTFITPQALAAFPLAAGLVTAFWQAVQLLWKESAKSPWICFWIAMIVALVNYTVSITDPKLEATSRDKTVGLLFALINGAYLFVTAMGIKVAATGQ